MRGLREKRARDAGHFHYLGSRVHACGSTSTNTGRVPVYVTAFAVATKVSGGMMISSSGPTPATMSARWRPRVPLETAIADPVSQRTLIGVGVVSAILATLRTGLPNDTWGKV